MSVRTSCWSDRLPPHPIERELERKVQELRAKYLDPDRTLSMDEMFAGEIEYRAATREWQQEHKEEIFKAFVETIVSHVWMDVEAQRKVKRMAEQQKRERILFEDEAP